jgi:hypothetical protein
MRAAGLTSLLTWYRSALPAKRVASAPFMPAAAIHRPGDEAVDSGACERCRVHSLDTSLMVIPAVTV